jgi:predicted dehydrogenase
MKSVLVLGLGSSGQRFVRLLRNQFGTDLDIFTLRRGKTKVVIAKDLQSSTPIDPSFHYDLIEINSLDELSDKHIDLIIISSISSSHFQDIQLISGLNFRSILVEKPLLLPANIEESSEIALRLLDDHVCVPGYFSRMHPLARKLKSVIRSESLGRPITYRSWYGENIAEMHPYEDYSKSYSANKEMGGGPLNTFSHDLDLMFFLFDSLIDVNFQDYKTDWSPINVQEVQNLRALAKINGNSFLVDSVFDFVTWPKKRCGEMIFEHGIVRWDWQEFSIEVLSMMSGLEVYDFSDLDFPTLIQDLVKSLVDGDFLHTALESNWKDFVGVGVILSRYGLSN